MQGDLWTVVVRSGLAGIFLVLPLLFATTYPQDLATLGPFADAWWVTVVLATVGLAFAVDAFVRLARLLRRGQRAVGRGYAARTVMEVVIDRRRDMGFLMRGARHFSVLEKPERDTLVTLRMLTPSLYAAAGAWMCLALALGLVMAARGWMGPGALAVGTLAPAGVLYLFGALTGLTVDARVRRARKAWHAHAWEDDLDPERVRAWEESAHGPGRPEAEYAAAAWVRALRRLSIATSVGAAMVFVPVLLLLPASAIGPALARVSVPEYQAIQRRAAELEAYRAYRTGADPSVTPGEAGRLLQNLAYVGSVEPVPAGELEPPLRIGAPWLPDTGGTNPSGVSPALWQDTLFVLAAAAPSTELRAYLASIAGHRARADLSRLAGAGRIDAAAGRWEGAEAVPVPRLAGLRSGAHAHIAAAAHELIQGRPAEAESLLREILSVGFLLADQGPTLMDNLVGHSMIREGGVALEQLYRVTNRPLLAEEMQEAKASAERTAARIRLARPSSSEALARMLPELVLDPGTVRGLAWESFALMATMAPCMNLNRVVFGPGDDYREFVSMAREALIRWPSEAGMFELAARRFLGSASEGFRPGRLLRLSVRSGEGACGDAIGRMGRADGGP
jgi:hypothetical protein